MHGASHATANTDTAHSQMCIHRIPQLLAMLKTHCAVRKVMKPTRRVFETANLLETGRGVSETPTGVQESRSQKNNANGCSTCSKLHCHVATHILVVVPCSCFVACVVHQFVGWCIVCLGFDLSLV